MVRFIVYLLILMCITSGFVWADDTRSVNVVTFVYYPVANPDSSGISMHIVRESFSAMGMSTHFQFLPRIRSMKMFEKSDTLLFVGEERYFPQLKGTLTSQKYIYFRVSLFYKKSRFPDFKFTGIENMKGNVLGASLGSNLTSVFEKAGWKVEETARLESNMRKLMNGRIDFWGTMGLTGIHMIKENYPHDINHVGMISIETFPVELVAKKGKESDQMLKIFREGLSKIIKDGSYMAILKKYYGNDVPESTPVRLNHDF